MHLMLVSFEIAHIHLGLKRVAPLPDAKQYRLDRAHRSGAREQPATPLEITFLPRAEYLHRGVVAVENMNQFRGMDRKPRFRLQFCREICDTAGSQSLKPSPYLREI